MNLMERPGSMHILITAGGTVEPIDSVRSITNNSTGKLSATICDAVVETASKMSIAITVHYVVASARYMPKKVSNVKVYEALNTMAVKETIEGILEAHTIHWMVHAMAISDYYVKSINPTSQFVNHLSASLTHSNSLEPNALKRIIQDTFNETMDTTKKIDSSENLVLYLDKTPKIIKAVHRLSPKTKLIGFKLLHDVDEEVLVDIATKQQHKNHCTFVVANDSTNVSEDRHHALFINNGQIIGRFETKKAIAEAIAREVLS